MKHALFALLLAFSVAAPAQEALDVEHDGGYAGPFDEKHVEAKRLERIAIGLRVRQNLRHEADRKEAQYFENRRRCQKALQVAELCGKFAGTFYCDEKGFQSIAADATLKPAAVDKLERYRMESCALEVARREPERD